MTITRVGTNQVYAEGWEAAFAGSKPAKSTGAKKGAGKAPAKKSAKASAKKAPAKKAAPKKAKKAKKK